MKAVTFFVLLTTLSTAIAHANEGFSADQNALPKQVQAAWNSTFLLIPRTNGEMGTAFLVRKESGPQPDQIVIYLLTANHVVNPNCGNGTGFCGNMIASLSLGFNMQTSLDITLDNQDRTIIGMDVVRVSTNPDLALLRATVSKSKFDNVTPIPLVSDCQLYIDQKIYFVGYPVLSDRASIQTSDKFDVIKRWSEGFVVDNFTSDPKHDNDIYYWTATTADALGGNSGGPALTEDGSFFGVLEAAAGNKNNGFKYVGDEQSDPKVLHSLITRCEYMQDFISGRPIKFKSKSN